MIKVIKWWATVSAVLLAGSPVMAQQSTVDRIESMPAIPQPYEMRDWKEVARRYVGLVFDDGLSGEYLPLCQLAESGNNYAGYRPLLLDTYVGWNAHGQGSEAINVMPAVVSACLTGSTDSAPFDLTEGIMDFFNSRNGQNVYLNSFSAESGKDWWYDLMPNVYFYQLYQLAAMPDADLADRQYRSVADQWLRAVMALGGSTYDWTVPDMGYRAFDLASMTPLASGVHEPESAGTIAWLLFHAWLETGDVRYRRGAELAMEFLNSLGSNPAYELQLAYGVQVAAKMNAMLGTDYDIAKMFGNCFDRGYLRGWGSIVGSWGGYDVSGLIGEANDKGDDYAFVMNGFQQVAALAPAVKYDKRFARAYGRWVLNVANASRLFYVGFLPEANMEPASYTWSVEHDPYHVIPYESMKEVWNGVSPYAMGDAVRGKWAGTNLSLYSGSSVGYLAAVVEKTDVDAVLQLNLNATDLDGEDKYPTYLYYNPYKSEKSPLLHLPIGTYRIYDAISESFLSASASGDFRLSVPADGVRLVTLIPADVVVREDDNRLYAGETVVDYHRGYNFDARLRIKNVEAADAFPVAGDMLTVKAVVDGAAASDCVFAWTVDGDAAVGQTGPELKLSTSGLALGVHDIAVTVSAGSERAVSESTSVTVVSSPVTLPEISGLDIDAVMPCEPATEVTVTCGLTTPDQSVTYDWSVTGGEIVTASSASGSMTWILPSGEGVFAVTCTASTLRGSVSSTAYVLVRRSLPVGEATPMLYFPFNGNLKDEMSGRTLLSGSGAAAYAAGYDGTPDAALSLTGNYFYLPDSPEISPAEAISLSFWANPREWTSHEQFLVSHGSWQDRYKVSITPDKVLRWTVKTSEKVVDIDSPSPLLLGRYEHFCAVYTGFSLELYRNGRLCAFAPLSGTLGSTSQPLTVGAMNAEELNYNYKGRIDELQIFDKALTPGQIKDAYDIAVAGVGDMVTADDDVSFFVDNGVLACTAPNVEITGVFALDGRRVARTDCAGVYIVEYVVNGYRSVAKIAVR